jgi:outer membrane lipoprotein-sorting protein
MMRRLLLCSLVLGIFTAAAGSSKEPAATPAANAAKQSASIDKPPAAAAPEAKNATKQPKAAAVFRDEPAAHALYNQMVVALRKANSLSYVSQYTIGAKGKFSMESTYKAWLKKPNYFRVEAESAKRGKGGVLIGDGNTLWIYWPQGRPQYGDDSDDLKTRLTSYMKRPAPLARHSIGHEVCYLGSGMSMPVLDPSTFHGYTDCMQEYIDGVRSMPAEKVGTEECDGIEVSIMKHQRSWYLWLSRRDHLPRKLRETVRVSYDLLISEDWTSVILNGDIPNSMFAWKPPKDWKQWTMPPLEAGLLKPGVKSPEFELASADGKRIKLSDYRGQIVWFYVWRAG